MAKKVKLTNGDDTFKGSSKDEIISARGGDDSVSGGGGNDTINGGAGNDFLRGGNGDDTLNGGEGDDRLVGGEGDDTLNGGAGVNIVDGGLGDDVVILDGNFKDAKITATTDGFSIVTAGGTTSIKNVENFQFADGVKGADELLPGAGKTFVLTVPIDNIIGTSGDDTVLGDSATLTADQIAGGDGKDVARIALTAAAAANYTPTMSGVERLELTGGGNIAHTFNFNNVTGVTAVSLASGESQVNLTGVKSILDLEISSTKTTSAASVDYAAATVAGAMDVQKISLTDATLATLAVNGAETLAFTAGGTANTIGTLTDTAVKAITVGGAGALTLTAPAGSTALASFDASTATGKQTITFAGTTDVAVKGGAADDTFNFGATFTIKDTVDGGAGKDTVSLDGGDYSLATNDTLKGLNALTNVEALRFVTGATTIDRATLTSAAVNTLIFDNAAGLVTVTNAKSTDTHVFGTVHGANGVLFNGVAPTSLTVNATGQEFVSATVPYADADVGGITAATTTTLAVASTGLAKDANGALNSLIGDATAYGTGGTTDANTNDLGSINLALNATVTLTGNAHTTLSLANAATLDATKLTGDLLANGSAGNDTIKGSTGVNEINAGAGVDTIDISLSASKSDAISYIGTTLVSLNRDSVTGFTAGSGGDRLVFSDGATTPANVATPVFQNDITAGNGVTYNGTADIIEFDFSNAGNSLGDQSTGALNGANLLALTGQIDDVNNAANSSILLVAYQGGNAYVYQAVDDDGAATTFDADGEIRLIAELKGVAVGGLTEANFDFV